MKCPKCQVEMAISKTTPLDNGDIEQEFSCRSKQCTNYKKMVETIINKQKNNDETSI